MSDDTLIKVEGVSKKFCLSLKKSLWYGLCDMGRELTGRRHGSPHPSSQSQVSSLESQVSSSGSQVSGLKSQVSPPGLRPKEFWAVHDVSFELKRGECLGLIGRNGAGKTTLLKMLNGLIKPDAGRIEMGGRVGALIALGAGFNPILTGRENIYVNGSVLGLSKREIDAKLDEIIDFAEIGEFIDTPVQNYSSGMTVRLGFGVAGVLIQPDVLLLDEVLAVGDIGFKVKCFNAVRKMMKNSAVIFVSHQMEFVSQFCTRVALMQGGCFDIDTKDTAEGISRYFALFSEGSSRAGTGTVDVRNVVLKAANREWQNESAEIGHGDILALSFDIHRVSPLVHGVKLALHIMDQGINPVVAIPIELSKPLFDGDRDRCRVNIPIGPIDLNAGSYSFVIGVQDLAANQAAVRLQGVAPFRVKHDRVHWGRIVRTAVCSVD